MDARTHERYVERAMWPIGRGDLKFWISVAVLSGVVLAGVYAWVYQLQRGLWVTGLNQKVSWGFYIINCVFFIGISYGGAMTSAILRLTNAKWRAPLTRLAEALAVAAPLVGAVYPLIDLGRPAAARCTASSPSAGAASAARSARSRGGSASWPSSSFRSRSRSIRSSRGSSP